MGVNRQPFVAVRNGNCIHCNFCRQYVHCERDLAGCTGCGACVVACPQQARRLEPVSKSTRPITFILDGVEHQTQGPSTVFAALQALGHFKEFHETGAAHLNGKCGTGGCGACAVLIDGVLTPSCTTTLREGMVLVSNPARREDIEPRRVVTVMRPAPHYHPSIFTHGCNYRCDLCHNWDLTFSAGTTPLSPLETVNRLNINPQEDGWVGISGGEATLNMEWLLAVICEIREQVPSARIQLDTNASLLTPDIIDALVAAGITDISPDLKALHLAPFMKISGLTIETLAWKYLQTSWEAVRYLEHTYGGQIFTAVSFPCHPHIHTREELTAMARALAAINPEIPVTLIEYQPAFRGRDWPELTSDAMTQVKGIMASAGIQNVLIQGGPEIPRARDPLNLSLSSESY